MAQVDPNHQVHKGLGAQHEGSSTDQEKEDIIQGYTLTQGLEEYIKYDNKIGNEWDHESLADLVSN